MRTYTLALMAIPLLLVGSPVSAIGIRTHAEIARMAVDTYLGDDAIVPEVAALFEREDNLRALYSGAAFPDWGYGGINPDVAEFSHWNPFMETYVNVLKRRFQPPWDAEAQRHISFFLGLVSHNITDIPWHFCEEEHRSFLRAGYDEDGASHSGIEFACDFFLYAERELQPSMRTEAWFPLDLLQEVFSEAGQEVTRWQLVQGTFRARVMHWGGGLAGRLLHEFRRDMMPWVYDHYGDYYYGGMEHGAAITAVMARQMVVRLHDGHYYQNTPRYASYVRRDESYVPRVHIEDTHIRADFPEHNAGAEPYIEVGGSRKSLRYGLLRVDLGDIPSGTRLRSAHLWLYRPDAQETPSAPPMTLAAHCALKPWYAGVGASDPVHGTTGREARDGEVRWTGSSGEPWYPSVASGKEALYTAAPVATAAVESSGWVRLDVTSAAQQWVDLPETNHGLLLRSVEDEGDAPVARFYSSDAFKGREDGYCGGVRVAYRPILLVWPE